MTVEEPRPSELSRRMDDFRDEFRTALKGIIERLDKVPTTDLLTAYLAKTDGEVAALKREIREVKDEHAKDEAELRAEIAKSNSELKTEIQASQTRAQEAKRWAVGVAISGGGLLVAVVGVLQRGGLS